MTTPSIPAELTSLLSAAAAVVTPAPLVRGGEPDIVGDPQVAYWFKGLSERPGWSRTLACTNRVSQWGIRAYFPLSSRLSTTSDDALEQWLHDLVVAVETQVWGHTSIGGASTGRGAVLSDAQAGYVDDRQGNQCRSVDWTLDIFLANISPVSAG